jgi:hypothetical protein
MKKKNALLALATTALLFNSCTHAQTVQQESQQNTTQLLVGPQLPKKKKIKLALLLDTSNSMDGLIDQAKAQLWNIVNELSKAKYDTSKPEMEIALYEYGNDWISAKEQYVRMVTPLTTDLDKISEDLFALRTNGGSEFCGEVIHKGLNQLDWDSTSTELQVMFIAGNEPFDQGLYKYEKACKKANNWHVFVNTIFCGNEQEGIKTSWKQGADLTKGFYTSIDQNQQVVFIESPYDDQIEALNDSLNNTYVYYGSQGALKKEKQVQQDVNSSKYGKSNKVNRTVTKSKAIYKNDSWDLVDAAKSKDFKVSTIDKSSLPKELKDLNDEQLKAKIAAQQQKRDRINKEIAELSVKREAYLIEKKKATPINNDLGNAIITALRKQAAAKNLSFDL